MKFPSLIFVAGFAALAGACTTDRYGYGPYYGPSQGYYSPGRGYYAPPPNYYRGGYGYGAPHGYSSGPSVTFTFPQGTIP